MENNTPAQPATPSAAPTSAVPSAAPSAAPAAAPSNTKPIITIDDFAKIDLRVATSLEAAPHPSADRLLKLQVDLGFEKRQICAGIRAYYSDPAALVGKQIIIVANLAPRALRGEVSNGMLLAASAKEGDKIVDVVLLSSTNPVPPGSTVG